MKLKLNREVYRFSDDARDGSEVTCTVLRSLINNTMDGGTGEKDLNNKQATIAPESNATTNATRAEL